jgi:hypothetical protein
MFTLMLVAETIILTYVANVAAFGVVAAIATHAAFNTSPGFLAGLFAHTDPRGPIPFQTLFILGGLVVALVLAIATRGRLGYRSSSA